MTSPPRIVCPSLRDFAPNQPWDALHLAFAPCPPIPFGQGWRDAPEAEFRPASVRVGWTAEALWFLSHLEDDDIHNAATRPNERTWELGDVFEIFVRRMDAPRYFEAHVTPENQTLQLELPHPLPGLDWPPPGLREDLLAGTRALVEAGQWRALAGIRFAAMGEEATRGAGWLFSCSRYDYTRGRQAPILSSASPHATPNFHDQSAWGTLTLE